MTGFHGAIRHCAKFQRREATNSLMQLLYRKWQISVKYRRVQIMMKYTVFTPDSFYEPRDTMMTMFLGML